MESSSTPSSFQMNFEEIRVPTTFHLKQDHNDKSIHPAFIEVGIKFVKNQILGSTARCVALLSACKKFVLDYERPADNSILFLDLGTKLENNLSYLRKCRIFSDGMNTAVSYIKYLLTLLAAAPELSDEEAKEWLSNKIDDFRNQKIVKAKEFITEAGVKLIKEGDTILVYARSHLVENIIIDAHEKGINFNLIIADNPPFYEGKYLIDRLSQKDIKATYTLINSVPYFMKKVNKVFTGCSAVLSNGNIISRVGTAMIGCIASNYRVPFHVFCETYKFSEQNSLDSFGINEKVDPKMVSGEKDKESPYSILNMRYDMTPRENINILVTEIGKLPPTSVPVIIREFTRNTYVGKIEPPVPEKKPL
jgi:translation initiation factor eIF-2B subunit delta